MEIAGEMEYNENLEKTDEVIVPTWTFAAPAFQTLRVGAIPIFADIKQDTYNIDECKKHRKI